MVMLWLLGASAFLSSCATIGTLVGKRDGVKPIIHRGYYKDHIYRKDLRMGRWKVPLYKKQGTRRVPHSYRSSRR